MDHQSEKKGQRRLIKPENLELLIENAIVRAWVKGDSDEVMNAEIERIRTNFEAVYLCDDERPLDDRDKLMYEEIEKNLAKIQSNHARPRRNQNIWWSDELNAMRIVTMASRRKYVRYRRRKGKDEAEEAQLYRHYRQLSMTYQHAIAYAKKRSAEWDARKKNGDEGLEVNK